VRVAIGTYIPGASVLHRADPRTKILIAFAMAIALFAVSSWVPLVILMATTFVFLGVARIPLRYIVSILTPVAWIALFTLAVNSLTWSAGFAFSATGFMHGLFFVMRFVTVMVGTSLVTLTTSPIDLTDGIALLMRPLARIKVPVEDIAMMISIGLRFIPTIADEVDRIMMAQKARGAVFDEGGLYRRIKAWVPVLIPLFVGLFRRADSLALAMEVRGYTGQGRTHLRELSLRLSDISAIIITFTALTALIVEGIK